MCSHLIIIKFKKNEEVSHEIIMIIGSSEVHVKYHDTRQEKTDLKVFVVVIPKEGWAHTAAPILLLA